MRAATLLLAAATIAGCAGGGPAGGDEHGRLLRRIDGDLKRCAERTGYDPGAAVDLPPNALGPGEREWRACAYEAVEKRVIPKAFVPDAYRQLIDADREMTDRVAAGQLTRAERRASLLARLQEIDRQERAAAAQVLQDAVRREREMLRMQDMRDALSRPMVR